MRYWQWVFLIVASLAFSQDYRAKVQGFVTDPSKAAIPAAKVVLKNTETGIEATQNSNEQGHYLFDFVSPGEYEVRVTAQGFTGFVQQNITVETRGDVTVNAALEVGKMAESLTVSSTPANVQFNTASLDQTVNRTMVVNLPVISRNPHDLLLLDPLIANGKYANLLDDTPNYLWSSTRSVIAGANAVNTNTNDILIDGSSNQAGQKGSYVPPMDAVQEVSVQVNGIDAEFGHSAGGITSMAMKSGTNEIHGSAYYFGRNPVINAAANGLTHSYSPVRNNIWGLTGSLPLIKNKLFTFTAYEGWRSKSPVTRYFTLPTAIERGGDYSQSKNVNGGLRTIYDPATTKLDSSGAVSRMPFAGNVIPVGRMDSTALQFAKDLWDPNSAGSNLAGANNYIANTHVNFKYYNFSERVDYNINDKWKSYARFSTFRNTNMMTDYVTSAAEPDSGGGGSFARNIGGDTVYTLSPNTVLDLRGSYTEITDQKSRTDKFTLDEGVLAKYWPNQWFHPYTQNLSTIYYPYLTFPNSTVFGVKTPYYDQRLKTWNLTAKLSRSQGAHYWKIGAEFRRMSSTSIRPNPMTFKFTPDRTSSTYISPNTKLSGDAFATFLIGALNSDSSANSIPVQRPRSNYWALYFQDDFKVSRRLTLTLGMRWEYNGAVYDSEDRLSRYLDLTDPIPEFTSNPPQMPAAVSAMLKTQPIYNGAWVFTDSSHRGMWDASRDSFMPRIGLAYRLDDKTVLRAGWARYIVPSNLLVDTLGSLSYPGFSATTTPLALLQGVPQAQLSDPFPTSTNPLILPVGKTQSRYTNLGAAATWNSADMRTQVNDRVDVSFQRQVTANTMVEVDYFTNLGFNVPYTLNLNQVDPQYGYQYGSQITKSVTNPFHNILPANQFYGSLRTQEKISISSLLVPYPQYTSVTQTNTSGGDFRMHALKLQARRQFKGGLTFLASYAYMRSSQSQFFNADDMFAGIFSLQQTTDPHHRLVLSGSYLLPVGKGRWVGSHLHPAIEAIIGGWAVSPIARYQSGMPLLLGQMQVSGDAKLDHPTPDCWFDTSKFAQSAAYTSRTNPWYAGLYGPRFVNIDVSLAKFFALGEKRKIELRMESYNLTNSIMFDLPDVSVTSSTFGVTNSQINVGREMQYAVRLHF